MTKKTENTVSPNGDDATPGIDTSETVVHAYAEGLPPALQGIADQAELLRLIRQQAQKQEMADRKRLDLTAWRKKQAEGESHTLPSGLAVQLRRVSVMDLAERGGVPQTLSGMVEQYVKQGEKAAIDILKQWPEYMAMVDLVVIACFIDPPVVEAEAEADTTKVWIGEFAEEDKLEIFGWANGPSRSLIPFRPKPE